MANTTHLGITLVEQSQAQKEVTVNDGITKIDAILNTGVIDKDLSNPPGSPAEGDVYIVGPAGSNDWNGQDDNIAHYTNGVWAFITPNEGLTIWVNDEDTLYTWNSTSWVESSVTTTLDDLSDVAITSVSTSDMLQYNGTEFVNSKNLDNLDRVGVNTTADATNKLSVKSDAVLFDTSTGDSQIKVNKTGSTDTASYLFQTGFSGRAEFGTVGDDNFSLKVSNDGGVFDEVFKTDNTTGDIRFKKQVFFDGDTVIDVAGKGLQVKEGTNARMGSAVLVAGTVTVGNTSVTANTRIFLTKEGSSVGYVVVSARTTGTSFAITSSSGADTSSVHWLLVEPA